MAKSIAIVGALDTKWEQVKFMKEHIEQLGHKTIVIDVGMLEEGLLPADVTGKEVAAAAGADIAEIRASRERSKITQIMTRGATEKARELQSSGKLDGIIGIGGTTGAFMVTSIMKGLPFGVPKLLVSSAAGLPGLATRFFGTDDVTVMHSVVEIAGLNEMLSDVMARAAGAICGMVESATGISPALLAKKGNLVAMSQFGDQERCATYVRQHLEQRGYNVVGFIAAGVGDRAMEQLLEQGFFDAVIELAPSGVSEELLGGMRAAGPTRLEAAGKRGIPQVIAPGGLHMMAPPRSKYKPEYEQRKKIDVDPLRTSLRLSPEEEATVAKVIADKLNKAKGQVKFLIPLRGWGGSDQEGGPLWEPETNMVFVTELRKHLSSEIEIREIDANLEDAEFALAIVSAFEEVWRTRK